MIKKYELKTNPLVLTKDIEKILNEKHRIMYYDDFITLELFDINEIITEVYDGEVIVNTIKKYQKMIIKNVDQIDEEGNEITEIETWEEFDCTQLLADIDLIITNHDPTPLPKPLTQEEEINLLKQTLADLTQEVLIGGI